MFIVVVFGKLCEWSSNFSWNKISQNVKGVKGMYFICTFLHVGVNFPHIDWNKIDNKENDSTWRGDNDSDEIKNNISP